jgi:hypothetical protein
MGDADGDLLARSPIELGRPAGAGPAPAGQPSELRGQQSLVDELVEVELRGVPWNLDPLSGLIAADGAGLARHEAVQRTPNRIGQRPDLGDPLGEPIVSHVSVLLRHEYFYQTQVLPKTPTEVYRRT